jgi:predicted lipid-binding transport protein (Tim44 family)
MEKADEEYKKAQKYDDTEAQQQNLERAKKAYEEAMAAWEAVKEDLEDATELCD